ncbi:MAG: hypothetical protein ABIO70_13370 [Pseudomonadota bacterium]
MRDPPRAPRALRRGLLLARHEHALDAFQEAFPFAEEALFVTAESFADLPAALDRRG